MNLKLLAVQVRVRQFPALCHNDHESRSCQTGLAKAGVENEMQDGNYNKNTSLQRTV
jgi:hypothetical protein